MVSTPICEFVEGVVATPNDRGLKLSGRDGWFNLSRYADPAPTLPTRGESVVIGLDTAGYVRSVEANTAELRRIGPSDATESVPAALHDRETCITRMACLNTATAILASGAHTADADAVLALAGRLEVWVLR